MKEVKQFLNNINNEKPIERFWSSYNDFCNHLETFTITELLDLLPRLTVRLQKENQSKRLFQKGIERVSSTNKSFGNDFYNIIVKSEKNHELLSDIIAGLSVSDKDLAILIVKDLIGSDEQTNIVQAISSIARFELDKSDIEDFKEYLVNTFSKYINEGASVEILKAILFVYRVHRKHFLKLNSDVLQVTKREEKEIKSYLVDIIHYSVDLDTEQEFYLRILDSLVTFDASQLGHHNIFGYMLSNLVDKNLVIVKNYINQWIVQDDHFKKIKVFESVFSKIYEQHPGEFQILITEWLNEDNHNYQLAMFNVIREMSYASNSTFELSPSLLATYNTNDIEYITQKIVGYIYDRKVSRVMLFSILKHRYDNTDITQLVGRLFVDYLIFNYYSTIDYLKEQKKDTNRKLKKIISDIIFEGERYYKAYSDLEILKEFEPSRERLRYMDKIQNKKMNKMRDENDKNDNSFLSMVTTLQFRTGKKAFGKFNGQYSQEMEPQLFSVSEEMPRGEYINPVEQTILRLEGQNFIRR